MQIDKSQMTLDELIQRLEKMREVHRGDTPIPDTHERSFSYNASQYGGLFLMLIAIFLQQGGMPDFVTVSVFALACIGASIGILVQLAKRDRNG